MGAAVREPPWPRGEDLRSRQGSGRLGGRGEGLAVEHGQRRAKQALLSLSSPGGPDEPLLLGGVQGGAQPSPCPAQARLLSLQTPVTREGQSRQRMARAAWRGDSAPHREKQGAHPGKHAARGLWPCSSVGAAGTSRQAAPGRPQGRRCPGVAWATPPSQVIAGASLLPLLALCVSSWRDVYSGRLPVFRLSWVLIGAL